MTHTAPYETTLILHIGIDAATVPEFITKIRNKMSAFFPEPGHPGSFTDFEITSLTCAPRDPDAIAGPPWRFSAVLEFTVLVSAE